MAINAEQLNIILSAQTKDLRDELAKAERRINGFQARAKKDLSATSKHFDMLASAAKRFAPAIAAAFSLQGIQNASRLATEILNLSKLAGVGAEQFQAMAFASSQFGIDQDKLADILKDVNDKLGDYTATGAGAMKDFFEQIGPKVGVTADAFRDLNSADALQLYVSSLEKANVSQAEMTFYLEALASDATALAPLLANNGAEMGALADKARSLGIVLDEDLIRQTAQMDKVWSTVMNSMSSNFTEFAMHVINGFDNIFGITTYGQFNIAARKMRELSVEATDLEAKMTEAAKTGSFAVDEFSGVTGAGVTNLEAAKDRLTEVKNEMAVAGAEMEELQILLDKLENAKGGISTTPETTPSGAGADGGGGGASSDTQRNLEALREFLDEFRMSETEAQIAEYEQRQALLEEALQKELLTIAEYNQLKAQNQQEHSDKIAEIVAAERAMRLGEYSSMFSALASIAEVGGKRAVKAQAVLSGAATMIAALETAQKAAAEATTIPGRLAAYGMFLAKGLETVKQIQSVGNSGRASGGGGSAATAAAAPPQVSRDVAIQLSGGNTFDRSQVIELINSINEAVEDGAVVRVV